MPESFEDSQRRIEQVLRAQEERFRKSFEEAIRGVQRRIDLQALADLLSAGRFEEALRLVDTAALQLAGAYGDAVRDSAQRAAFFLTSQLNVNVVFDQVNERLVDNLRTNQFRLVQQFTGEQREMLQRVLSEAAREGINPIDMARRFRSNIGLTDYQSQIVENYRRELSQGKISRRVLNRLLRDKRSDKKLLNLIDSGGTLNNAEIDSLVNRYRDRWIKYRSKVIARTEALRAAHEGTELMYRQAIEDGALSGGEIMRTWRNSKRPNVRDSHQFLDGQKRRIGEYWTTSNGRIRYPGDPEAAAAETVQCRCIAVHRFELFST